MKALFALLVVTIVSLARADDVPPSRLLIIGLDGCRPDALAIANTPAIDALIANGTLATTTQILGPRYHKSDTVSGPGWSSFLTGVWADKHGVHDNSFDGANYKSYPHIFQRVKQHYPQARTGSFVDWKPIDDHIVTSADERVVFDAHGASGYTESDTLIARSTAAYLKNDDPHIVMTYFGAIDETGHAHGFHPDVEEYRHAIETVDEHIDEVVTALQSRPNYQQENWLILISTDHGGQGTGHGGGKNEPEIRNTFLIVSGDAAQRGTTHRPTYIVDLVATGLAHLGIIPDQDWKLDGQPISLKSTATTGLRLSWDNRFLTIRGNGIAGEEIRIHYLEAYCRPKSSNQDWKNTVIPHKSKQLIHDPDGKYIVIEDVLQDGVIVTHKITAELDEICFEVTAHNPTQKTSLAHWAQPCMRIDKFTGADLRDAHTLQPPYIQKCFLVIDGRLTRLPTLPWATKARYTPGQVYAAAGIDRNDVNPRPLSSLTPSCGLCGCFSADEQQILAIAWEPYQEIFQGVATCMHNDFRIGGLASGETKTIKGRLYILPNNEKMLFRRYAEDFPTNP